MKLSLRKRLSETTFLEAWNTMEQRMDALLPNVA